MNKDNIIEVKESEVPTAIVFRGPRGQVAVYELKPASRKFGLSLQAASEMTKAAILDRR